MLSRDLLHVHPGLIKIRRDERQRRTINVDDLVPSIKAKGVMLPLIVRDDPDDDDRYLLVAGERRLTAAAVAGLDSVPVRLTDSDLSESEIQEIELEENIRRVDLPWQDRAKAVHKLHLMFAADNESWSGEATAQRLNLSAVTVNRDIGLAEAMIEDGDDSAIARCETRSQATTMLERRRSRKTASIVDQVLSVARGMMPKAPAQARSTAPGHTDLMVSPEAIDEQLERDPPPPEPDAFRIEHADAFKFFAEYDGPKFNLIHVDFPYGVKLGEQANQESFEAGYDSDRDIYWALCEAMRDGWKRFASPSAHLMFWCANRHDLYMQTVEFLSEFPDIRLWHTPLYWHKTDSRGIIADAKRGPRNITEIALFASFGDRFIVKPTNNTYGGPTNKSTSIHPNEKNQAMLEYFFGMLVDEHTNILDPTCGSGVAIRAAEELGAASGLGLEHSAEFAERAAARLRQARGLRVLSKKVGNDQSN